MGPRNAVLGGGDACECSHWGLRWSSLWGLETREGCAEIGGVTHAVAPTWAFGGAPYGATKRVRGMPNWVRWAHANAATGAFGGAPYGATKRVRGVPKWVRWAHANAATGAFGGAPDEATKRVRVCRNQGVYPHADSATGDFGGAPYGQRNV